MIDKTCFSWIQLIKKTNMPSNAKYICFYLSTFMNLEHNIAWPSQSRIAGETGLSEPTVRKWLDYLSNEGWLIIKKKSHYVDTGNQNYLHNEYIIDVPEQRVNDLLSDVAEGKQLTHQRVNESRAEGKQLTPNNNRNNNNNNNGRFTPPTVEEVAEYIKEKGYQISPENFVNHYEATNWYRGKTKIKNWRACVGTWVKNTETKNQFEGVI